MMADPNSTFAIDNTQVYNVTANSVCRRIVVQENYDSANVPTADLLQYRPATSSTPTRVAKGTPAIYTKGGTGAGSTPISAGWYTPGEVAGGIKTSAGSITVQQVEGAEI